MSSTESTCAGGCLGWCGHGYVGVSVGLGSYRCPVELEEEEGRAVEAVIRIHGGTLETTGICPHLECPSRPC